MPPIISLACPPGQYPTPQNSAPCDLEAKLIRHAAPTLAGIKPANLFTWRIGEFAPEDANAAIEEISTRLNDFGVCVTSMAQRTRGILVLAWRPALVREALSAPKAQAILRTSDFPSCNHDLVIAELKRRIAQADTARMARAPQGAQDDMPEREKFTPCCAGLGHAGHHHEPGHVCQCRAKAIIAREEAEATMGEAEFPHEIGLVLGYPPVDVAGFIEHKGADFVACGGWKAYANPESALQTFQQNRRCADEYRRMHAQGASLEALCDIRGANEAASMFAALKAAV